MTWLMHDSNDTLDAGRGGQGTLGDSARVITTLGYGVQHGTLHQFNTTQRLHSDPDDGRSAYAKITEGGAFHVTSTLDP